jgi:hypothetical protein
VRFADIRVSPLRSARRRDAALGAPQLVEFSPSEGGSGGRA